MVQAAFDDLSAAFSKMYSSTGRPSIAPEKLLKALLLQVFYSIRSERMLMEQLDYNLLFRWFVGLAADDPIWDRSVFSKNRDRLIESDIALCFLESIKKQADEAGLLSDEHFTVDGTLIEAWASVKSFKKKDGPPSDTPSGKNPEVDFHGEKRCNETHASTTDPECRLYKKSKGAEAKLCYLGHVLMENRSGLAVDARLTLANGTAEREAAIEMIEQIPGSHRITVGADKAFDVPDFVKRLRGLRVTPHVARKEKGSAIDSRTTRHAGYSVSQRIRKRVEEIFGWAKTVGVLNKTKHRGKYKVGWNFMLTLSAFNLVRMRSLGLGT